MRICGAEGFEAIVRQLQGASTETQLADIKFGVLLILGGDLNEPDFEKLDIALTDLMEEVRPDITCLEYKCDEEPPSRNETCASASGIDGERPLLNGILLSGPLRPDGNYYRAATKVNTKSRKRRSVQPAWQKVDEEQKYSLLA